VDAFACLLVTMDLHLADPLVMQDPSIAARIHHNLRLREQQLAYYGRYVGTSL